MLRMRVVAFLAVVLGLILTTSACGSAESGSADDVGASASATPAGSGEGTEPGEQADEAAEPDEPVVRLTKVTYQGLPSYEFEYGPAGEPKGYTYFHPVTGDPLNKFVVTKTDAEGRPTEFSIENLESSSTSKSVFTYDDQGRIATSMTTQSSGDEQKSARTYTGPTVKVVNSGSTYTYKINADGNITASTSVVSGDKNTTKYLTFDDAPNPRSMTGGLLIEVKSANNAMTWSPPDGCTYTEEPTYEDGLLVGGFNR